MAAAGSRSEPASDAKTLFWQICGAKARILGRQSTTPAEPGPALHGA